MEDLRPIVPSLVVQEEGARKVFVYLDIPELKVKRSFPNLTKFLPTNVEQKRIEFQHQSLLFTMTVQTRQNTRRIYTLSVARLPGEIEIERCSIKYQRGGCWITLIKSQPMSWMNRICDDLNPGLDIQENEGDSNANSQPSAPAEEQKQLRETSMPPPFSLVPLAPPPPRSSSSSHGQT